MDEPSRLAETDEELEEFRQMVRQGRLFEVQEWVAQGKPVFKTGSKKRHALWLAVENGFHSMVEVLAAIWPDQQSLDQALQKAVSRRRVDHFWILLRNGANIKTVTLFEIATLCDMGLMRHVLEHWDEIAGEHGIVEILRARPRPLTGLPKEWLPRLPNHDLQLSTALTFYIQERSHRWVGLAIWMGVNFRLRIPAPDYPDPDSDEWESPLESAASYANAPALKLMKPNPKQDDLDSLLGSVSPLHPEYMDAVRYLVAVGARINNRPDGTSEALSRVLSEIVLTEDWSNVTSHPFDRLEWATTLIKQGARFGWESNAERKDIRRLLYRFRRSTLMEFLRTLASACEPQMMTELLDTDKFKKILEMDTQKLKKFVEGLYKPKVERRGQWRNLKNISR